MGCLDDARKQRFGSLASASHSPSGTIGTTMPRRTSSAHATPAGSPARFHLRGLHIVTPSVCSLTHARAKQRARQAGSAELLSFPHALVEDPLAAPPAGRACRSVGGDRIGRLLALHRKGRALRHASALHHCPMTPRRAQLSDPPRTPGPSSGGTQNFAMSKIGSSRASIGRLRPMPSQKWPISPQIGRSRARDNKVLWEVSSMQGRACSLAPRDAAENRRLPIVRLAHAPMHCLRKAVLLEVQFRQLSMGRAMLRRSTGWVVHRGCVRG